MVDIVAIQSIDVDYYAGSITPVDVLQNWLETFPEGFWIAEEAGKPVAYLFIELLEKFMAVDFIHDARYVHRSDGRYMNISGIGVSNAFRNTNVCKRLLEHAENFARKHSCKQILFIIGVEAGIGNHDIYERELAIALGFTKKQNVPKWKVGEDFYVSDHWIWVKELV